MTPFLNTLSRRCRSRGLAVVATLALAAGCHAEPSQVTIDWTKTTGPINRGVFGIEGIPKVFAVAQRNPRLLDTFLRLNPQGQAARMETWVGYFEPENDNDDPETFDWSRLQPEKMTRFIEPGFRQDFADFLVSIDAELMPLLCYNTEWLESGDADDPVADKDEWVEFAAGVTHAWNVLEPDAPQVKYVEVWNEPNMPMFYGGSRASYFEIFRKTAERYHRDYPDVMVGGPALTPAYWAEPDEWYADFIETVGEHADYVTHHIYHDGTRGAADVAAEVVEKVDMFRALPGKENGRLALTETDGWFNGWPKTQYLLDRHFAFLKIQDRLLSSMHFTTLAYNESSRYVFGVMTEPGAPLADTYWPFWIARNLAGELVEVENALEDVRVVATRHDNGHGETLYAALLWNRGDEHTTVRVNAVLPDAALGLPTRVDVLGQEGPRIELHPGGVPREDGPDMLFELQAGEAAAVTVYRPGRRHLPFSDLNDQEGPAVLASVDRLGVATGETVNLTGRVANTLAREVRGTVELEGLPDGWTTRPLAATEITLEPGVGVDFVFEIDAGEEPPHVNRMAFGAHGELKHLNHAVPIVAVWVDEDGNDAASLPVDLVYLAEPTTNPTTPNASTTGEHVQP